VSLYTQVSLTFTGRAIIVAGSVFRSDGGRLERRRMATGAGSCQWAIECCESAPSAAWLPGKTTKPMGALVRVTLAIYITLFAIASVAVAQTLYWKLVIAREGVAIDQVPETNRMPEMDDIPDMDWLHDPAESWVGFEADDMAPALAGDPVLVGV
jgi:hypothetical protein